jgi:diguanylate cyclase (GGDEF)-like protein
MPGTGERMTNLAWLNLTSEDRTVTDSPEIFRLIETATLFRGVPREKLELLFREAKLVTLAQGEKLLSPNRINENVYIVISGRLSVQATPSSSDKPIAMLTPGECVGEMSVLVDGLVSTYVIAATDCELLSIDYASFWSLIDNSSEAARNMFNILVHRLRLGNRIMADSLLYHDSYPGDNVIDNLTGLYNYHGIHRKFDRLLPRCAVDNEPLCLIVLEADEIEKAMEYLGDEHVDQSLRTIAQSLLKLLRPDDHAARLVGGKFAVLLANTSLDGALATAERLRATISETPILLPDGSTLPPVTVSTGVAEALPQDKWTTFVARADIALEKAMGVGRKAIRA